MNLFHHDDHEPVDGPMSQFDAPPTHGSARQSSFGRPEGIKQSAEEGTTSAPPPMLQLDGPVQHGCVTSTSMHAQGAPHPGFGAQLGSAMGMNSGFGLNGGMNGSATDMIVGGMVGGIAANVVGAIAAEVVGDVLGGLFDN